jgi:Kdo2-lipid IVA lauroyltransferase/acyltransferase
VLTRIALVIIWILHWLPLPAQAAVGWALGHVLYVAVRARRNVVLTNLRLCFPALPPRARARLARRVVVAVVRSMLERGVTWWSSPARIRRVVELRGLDRVRALQAAGEEIIILLPHFVGLDMAGTRLNLELDLVTMYSAQSDKLFERMLLHGRTRFGRQVLVSRQEGVRAAVKAMRDGLPMGILPDMDFGPRESIFVPFFGVLAATIPAVSRIARLAKARVIPLVIRQKSWGRGYLAELGEPWHDFPTDDVVADTRRMNAFIEAEVLKQPDQYYWVHKRFKTRPDGAEKVY